MGETFGPGVRMSAAVEYPGGSLEFPFDDDRIVGAWSGPAGRSGDEVAGEIRRALERPLDFPPLRQAIVPGDRVILAVDPGTPELSTIVAAVVNVIESAGIDREQVCVLATDRGPEGWEASLPAGIAATIHDPDASGAMAYLATTSGDRRIYLNRELTDADFVLPIGPIGRDPILVARGPWSVLFPDMSDHETRRQLAAGATKGGAARSNAALDESQEVGWLLGNQFQIGVVPGSSGVAALLAGDAQAVRKAGLEATDAAWTLRADRRADLVVVGTGADAGVEGTWSALALGASLVRRGGKVVALSGATGPIGAAASRLAGADGAGAALSALRGAEGEADYAPARQLADALSWADLYLYSGLDPDVVEDLGLIPLARPEEARRLAAASPQITLVSHAELTRGEIVGEES